MTPMIAGGMTLLFSGFAARRLGCRIDEVAERLLEGAPRLPKTLARMPSRQHPAQLLQCSKVVSEAGPVAPPARIRRP